MMDFLPFNVHEEYEKRMTAWNERQDARIAELEEMAKENQKMILSIEKLANSMEGMMKELHSQGSRLKAIEDRDGEMWRKVTGYIITAVVGILVGYVFQQIGM